ncbi:MAG TPA: hypothetical protein VMP01_16350 [Pirellulaceae bacterium]|nr:hypothetical protein [Pirellulaceae bacterium]
MTQTFGVIVAGLLALTVTIGYMMVFEDEFNENAPVNRGGELLTPIRRHFTELVLLQMATFLTALAIYFALCESENGIKLDWPKVMFMLFWLHVLSGALIITGLAIAIANGQAVHWRDGITLLFGIFFLACSIWDRSDRSDKPADQLIER